MAMVEVELTSEPAICPETVHSFDLEIQVLRYLRYHVGPNAYD